MHNGLIWHVEKRKLIDLKTWEKNPRKISTQKFNELKQKITERGFHDVIVIDTDNTILSGNMRKKALMDLGVEDVSVLVPIIPLSEDQRNKVALESNKHEGEWDFDLLKSFDFDLLTDVGFDQFELDECFKSLEVKEEEFDEKEELKKIIEPVTKLGDVIQLGEHRLICGDSTDSSTLLKLLGDEKASMIYSDPVYNIDIDYNRGISGRQSYGGNVNDNRSFDEYRSFIKQSLDNALSVTDADAHVFYWCDQVYIGLIQDIYRELGIDNKRVCLWIKNAHNPTPNVAFNKCYEPCVYGVRGKPYISSVDQNINEVLNKEATNGNEMFDDIDIWLSKRLSGKDYEHATSKPPQLHDKAIRRCTKPNDIILDSFAGSGSTLIAAHQLKRRFYGVELEPAFCDLIMRRFEKLTGIKSKIIRHHEEA